MNYEKLKEQLMLKIDEIVKTMMNGNDVEIKKDKNDNILLYELKKKKIKD